MRKLCSRRNREIIEKNEPLLVGYLTAGYPHKEEFPRILARCSEAGLDIVEIGFPAQDPSSDGEVIRHAHEQVDRQISHDIEYWKTLRSSTHCPIWLMGYRQDLIDTGMYKKLAEAGVLDGLVVPDIAPEETFRLGEELAPFQVDMVCFMKADYSREVAQECMENSSLLYYQLLSGPTGTKGKSGDYSQALEFAGRRENCYLFAGFGIDSPGRARELVTAGFKGAIVGTAMIRKLNQSEHELYEYIREMKQGVKG